LQRSILTAHNDPSAAILETCSKPNRLLHTSHLEHAVVAAAGRAGAKFSITAGKDRAVTAAIAGIDEGAWVPIGYPQAVFDE